MAGEMPPQTLNSNVRGCLSPLETYWPWGPEPYPESLPVRSPPGRIWHYALGQN